MLADQFDCGVPNIGQVRAPTVQHLGDGRDQRHIACGSLVRRRSPHLPLFLVPADPIPYPAHRVDIRRIAPRALHTVHLPLPVVREIRAAR
jgi:hypothetical protein